MSFTKESIETAVAWLEGVEKNGLNSVHHDASLFGLRMLLAGLESDPQPAAGVLYELKEAAADFLTVLDEYPEKLVPVNRDSAVVRSLRAAMHASKPKPAPVAALDENGLLPCPFCGSSASIVDDRPRFLVECQNEHCGIVVIGQEVPELQSEEEAERIDFAALEQSAKDKWNSRAAPRHG